MVTPLTWTSYLDTIARLAVVAVNDANFVALAPQMVNYAELRIYRDLDLLWTVTPVVGFSTTAGIRTMGFPSTTFITLQDVNVITPVGTGSPNNGTRNPLVPTTREFLTAVYGTSGSRGLPHYFAMLTQNVIIFGPWPDQNYSVELIGTVRPPSLGPTVSSTLISTFLPDLMVLASMIWISGYQRNFGRQSDDPQMAVSYESQYMTMLKGAMVEEARKKFQAAAWTAQPPAPVASPSRNAA